MVRYVEINHVFKHPFEAVARAYFQKILSNQIMSPELTYSSCTRPSWLKRTSSYGDENVLVHKYTCGKDSNVTSITVLEHRTDPETGEEYLLRRGECVNVLPGLFRKLCPFSAIVVEEEAWLNRKERCLRLHCYNLTWSKYASMEEFSTYRACDNNPNWTSFEQRGSISINGVGSLIGGMMEGFAQTFLQRGANKGFRIMEDLIMTMSGRYTEA